MIKILFVCHGITLNSRNLLRETMINRGLF